MVEHRLSLITDELQGGFRDALAFARAEGLQRVDIRTIDGANIIGEGKARQREAGRLIREAGLEVGCVATPILKWARAGARTLTSADQYGFDPGSRSAADWCEAAASTARELGTRHLRIFTYLSYEGYVPRDLAPDYQAMLALAEAHDLVLHVENEPVCNVRLTDDLQRLVESFPSPRLRVLLDIGNMAWAGHVPSESEIARIMPWVDQLHFKDYRAAGKRVVALGEGDVPYHRLLAAAFDAAAGRPLTLTIETHVPGDQPGATQRSLAHLRSILRDLGQPAA